MRAGAVQHHAADGPQKDPQSGHGDDGNEDGVECLQHVACSADLVGLHKVWVLSDVFNWRGERDAEKESEM